MAEQFAPTASVVMSVYNGELYLAEAIDSILAQTLTDFELLIVDDGSQDSSAQIIRSYTERDSRIRFFQLERNMGIADARNHAIAAATGEFITIMDCDDISMPKRLEKQASFLEANPDIGVVGVSGRAVSADLAPLFDLNLQQQHCKIVLDLFVGVGLIYSTIMLRGNSLCAIGGYEPGRRTSEERDLAWRLLYDLKLRFANLPEHLLLYRRHERSIGHTKDLNLLAERVEVPDRMLRQLWGEAPPQSLDLFLRLRMYKKLGWAARRAAKEDILRLIDSLIESNCVDESDKPLLIAAMNQRLEQASPRLWQQFSHWRRYRFGSRSAQSDAIG